MSVVYQAENPRLGNVIALKILAPELASDDVFRTRFLEESRIAAAMNHPNVIPIHDMGASDGLLYIAMRWVAGTDLRQMIKKRGRLQADTTVFLLSQVARALDAAHRRGLVHRDVKPGNLLIERASEDGDPDHVYLTDFGIAKLAMSRTGLTSTGQFVGTIDYVAPEQIRGMSVLGMADQYSLGCVLYECLTGRVPFEKDLDAAIIWAHVEEHPTRPTLLRPDLPLAIDGVFARVLAKQPGDRFDSCREFMEAASAALGDLATSPPPSGSLGNLRTPVPGSSGGPADVRAGSASAPPTESMLIGEPPARSPGYSATATSDRDGITADRRESGGEPPEGAGGSGGSRRIGGRGTRRGPGRGAPRARWVASASAVIVVAAGAAAWALAGGSSTPAPHPTGSASPSLTAGPASPTSPASSGPAKPEDSDLMKAIKQAATSTGRIDTSRCSQMGATMVTCLNPSPSAAITEVVFQTYPSLPALYAAYQADARKLKSGFAQGYQGGCDATKTDAEATWNHARVFSTKYSIEQMAAGMVTDDQAAGRLFCTYSTYEYYVWTQNDGRLLGYAVSQDHASLWTWWVAVHHHIALGGKVVMPGMGPMSSASASSASASPGAPMSSATPVSSGGRMAPGKPKSS
jgi:serine/threonine protein kinase